MSSEPRHFVLQARDLDHGCPGFEARFPVTELDDLRVLIGADADDDPELEGSHTLDAGETPATSPRQETRLPQWRHGSAIAICCPSQPGM